MSHASLRRVLLGKAAGYSVVTPAVLGVLVCPQSLPALSWMLP
ncbi:hypothetical protein [Streptomyces sp. NPDC017260]